MESIKDIYEKLKNLNDKFDNEFKLISDMIDTLPSTNNTRQAKLKLKEANRLITKQLIN